MQQTPSSAPNGPSLPSGGGRIFLFLLVAALTVAVDLGTKRFWFDRLGIPSGKIEWLIPNFFGFQTSLNSGALWGLGSGHTTLLVIASFAALIGIGFWLRAEGRKSLLVVISLSLITGGILGNLWDRLALHGIPWPPAYGGHLVGTPAYAVRDWILVVIGSYHWPNFNIADSCLVCGVILMFLRVLFFMPSEKTKDGDEESSEVIG
ncbi:MAG: signal peptidase II [Thermoguttaceae bacterium]|jgi:signal peptidase II